MMFQKLSLFIEVHENGPIGLQFDIPGLFGTGNLTMGVKKYFTFTLTLLPLPLVAQLGVIKLPSFMNKGM